MSQLDQPGSRQSSNDATARAPIKVFIDGEAGTVGLGIRERLADVRGVELVSIAHELRKDARARRELLQRADLAVLCLPDGAAKEAVALANELGDEAPKLLDASSAHRVAPGWTYGFAELTRGHADVIRKSARVSNPGCYATAAIALLRPLVDAQLIAADYPLSINAVSGYSGGGKSMIEAHESGSAPSFKLYALSFEHKHLPEIERSSGLTRTPLFVPSVGNFRQGMLLSIPLHLDHLPSATSAEELHAALQRHYAGSEQVSVLPLDFEAETELEAEALNNSDKLELRVFTHRKRRQAVLVARLDNLGKGAAGAAIQNIKLMGGLEA